MRKLFLALLICPLFTAAYAQTIDSGNLLRLRLDKPDVILSDTLGYWITSVRSNPHEYVFTLKEYYAHFQLNSRNYLLKKYTHIWDYGFQYFSSYSMRLLVNEDTKREREISLSDDGNTLDYSVPYMMDKSIIIETDKGNWLINGFFGNSFIADNDSLYIINSIWEPSSETFGDRFVTIAGYINKKPLAVFENPVNRFDNYDYYLIDISDSSKIDSSKMVMVEFSDSSDSYWKNPFKIRSISQDLYFVQKEAENELSIYRFENNKFYPVKSLLKNYFKDLFKNPYEWDFRNNKFYAVNNSQLISFDYSEKDTSLINEKILIDTLTNNYYSFDRSFGNAAVISGNALKIFNLEKEAYTNSIDLTGIDAPSRPLIDSPYVFIHQTKYHFTDVRDERNANLTSYKLSAYPNPFNSSVKIYYSLPEDKETEISIYDILGRKIATLVNEMQRKGNHHVIFNAGNLSAGVYLYNLTTDNYRKTNKLLLLK